MSNGIEKIIENKTDYNRDADNFVIENELTVTITLNEYRQLVINNAISKSEIDEANKDKYTRERQIEQLEAENERLKSELYELQKYSNTLEEEVVAAQLEQTACKQEEHAAYDRKETEGEE